MYFLPSFCNALDCLIVFWIFYEKEGIVNCRVSTSALDDQRDGEKKGQANYTMTAKDAGGRRLIGAAGTLSMAEMARILRSSFPDYAKKIPRRTLSGFLVKFIAIFDRALKSVIPDIGVVPIAENGYVAEITGVNLKPPEEAVRSAGPSLIDHSLV
jgi:hypothetical protein